MDKEQMFLYLVGAGLMKFAIHYLGSVSRPQHAQQVGRVKSVWLYPIKSVRGLALDKGEATFSGLKANGCMDRQWMLVTRKDGKAVTAREFPKLITMNPSLEADGLHLDVYGMETLILSADPIEDDNTIRVINTCGTLTEAIDCGDEAAEWMEKCLRRPPGTFRLVFNPIVIESEEDEEEVSHWPAERQPPNKVHFHQNFSFMMTCSSSLADLNRRISERHKTAFMIPMLQFRPNLEIEGSDPYAEDKWKDIYIGETAKFTATRLCDRCVFTLINPETGEKCKEGEPLVTLRKYRPISQMSSGPYKIGPSSVGSRPTFGMNFVLSHPGKISVGDIVYAT